jgi:hypothetical protein
LTPAHRLLTFPAMSISSRLVFDVCHEVYQAVIADSEAIPLIDPTKIPSDHLWRSHKAPTGEEYAADFSLACKAALIGPQNASRLILCKLYYLDLLPYEQARNYLGLREDVWAAWTDEIRNKVGEKLLHKGMFPPKKYFGERSRPRRPHVAREDRGSAEPDYRLAPVS